MSREISSSTRSDVVRLYFEGFSYDRIAEEVDVAKGSVATIIQELRDGKFPQLNNITDLVDHLREVAVGLSKLKISAAEGGGLFILLRRLIGMGVEPKQLEVWVRLCQSVREAEGLAGSRIIKAAIELAKLEGEGLTYEDVLGKLNSSSTQLKELAKKIDEARADQIQLDSRKDTLTQTCAELESQRKRMEGESRKLAEKVERLTAQAEELKATVGDRQAVLSRMADNDRDLTEKVSRLEERAAALQKQVEERTLVLKELEDMGFSRITLEQVRRCLSGMAEHYGKEGLANRFFEHLNQFDLLLVLETTTEVMSKATERCTAQQNALAELSARFELSVDEILEGIAALKTLQKKGVVPSAIVSYTHLLTRANTDPQSFQKLVSEYSDIEQAIGARRGDLAASERQLEGIRRAVEALKVEESGIKESIATLRQSAVQEIGELVGSAKSEVNRLFQSMQQDISKWGTMRSEMGKYQEELRMARYFCTVPLSQDALNNLISEVGAPIILQYLTISRAWCRAKFNPKQKPPLAIIKKHYQIGEHTPVELVDIITWALAMFVGGTTA